MAVLAIEWRISQRLKELDTMSWDQLMDHFLKVLTALLDYFDLYRGVAVPLASRLLHLYDCDY